MTAPEIDALFRAQAPRLHRLAMRFFAQPEAAEDAMQETFVRALERMEQFRSDADVATWLYRIAVNVCLDGLRRDSRRRTRPIEEASEIAGCPMLIRAAEQRWMLEAVDRGIRKLKPDHRLLIILRDLEGMSYDDIRAVTGLPIGTISSRLNRAREELARGLTL
jgi:RNA polymerase sigma-70 factor (ECF subfamily)